MNGYEVFGFFAVGATVLTAVAYTIKRRRKSTHEVSKLAPYIPPERNYDINKTLKDAFEWYNRVKDKPTMDEVFVTGEINPLIKKMLQDEELVRALKSAPQPQRAQEMIKEWIMTHRDQKPKRIKKEMANQSTKPLESKPISIEEKPRSPVVQEIPTQKEEPKKSENIIVSKKERREDVSPQSKELSAQLSQAIEQKNVDLLIEFIQKTSPEKLQQLVIEYKIAGLPQNDLGVKTEKLISTAKKGNDLYVGVRAEIITGLNERYELIKSRISFLRKNGINMNHEQLLVMTVPQKIKVFEATFDKKDFQKVREQLEELETEIKARLEELQQKQKTN